MMKLLQIIAPGFFLLFSGIQPSLTQGIDEKLFISTDREVYLPGQEIFIKVWQVAEDSHQASEIGYLELLDHENDAIIKKTLKFSESGSGVSILLPEQINSGYFILRAYTSGLKKYGPEHFAYKKLLVMNPAIDRKFNFPFSKEYSGKTVRASFYPEGGRIVRGVMNRVYIEFENLPSNAMDGAFLTNDALDTIARLEVLDKHHAYLDFIPYYGSYELRLPEIYPHKAMKLPATDTVRARLAYVETFQGLDFIVQKTDSTLEFNSLRIEAGNREKKEPCKIIERLTENPHLDYREIEKGLNRFRLLDEKNNILSELYYLKPAGEHLRIQPVSALKNVRSRDSVQISLLAEYKNTPVSAYLNIYVKRKTENYIPQRDFQDFMNFSDFIHLEPTWDFNSSLQKKAIAAIYGPELYKNKQIDIDKNHLSDKAYFAVRGQYKNGKAEGRNIYLSFPGDSSQIFTKRTGEKGEFEFILPSVYGVHESFIKTDDSIKEGLLILEEMFFLDYLRLSDFPGEFDSSQTALLDKYYREWKINNYFDAKSRVISNEKRLLFYDQADFRISMENYIDFPNMAEVFFEIIKPVMIFNQNRNPYLKVIDRESNRTIGDKPLYVIDGVPFTDPSYAMGINPERVRDIAVISRQYFIGDEIFDGVIIINTRRNDLSDIDPQMLYLRQDVIFPERKSHKVIKTAPDSVNIPFIPSVSYWNSSLKTGKDGRVAFSIIVPDNPENYEIVVEAFDPESGKFGFNTFEIESEKD